MKHANAHWTDGTLIEMAFMVFLYWGPWRGSAPYLWAEKGGIIEPTEVLPVELQGMLAKQTKLQPGLTHIAGWTVFAYPDGSAFLASVRINETMMAELAAEHFPAPWRRLTERRVA